MLPKENVTILTAEGKAVGPFPAIVASVIRLLTVKYKPQKGDRIERATPGGPERYLVGRVKYEPKVGPLPAGYCVNAEQIE